MALILALESSCDDLAAAVVRDGVEVLASVVQSQDAVHAPYGGVVPELDACFAALDLQSCIAREPGEAALPAA